MLAADDELTIIGQAADTLPTGHRRPSGTVERI
jgi:hypothetical protein